jgi:type II secretory pathway pseudopilin PulG
MSRRSVASRRAFTLVEILFVILIIMILMGLLLVAIRAVMDASRRTQCMKNLTEIGRSMRQFISQFDGRSAGTIPDPTGTPANANPTNPLGAAPPAGTAPVYGTTGGVWTFGNGTLALPKNNDPSNAREGAIGMQGWDGYMGYALQQYEDEVRRMWNCRETDSPYVGNVAVLGRWTGTGTGVAMREMVPKFKDIRTYNSTSSGNRHQGLWLSPTSLSAIQNPGKCVVAYDAGIGLAGETGLAKDVTNNCTDFDDGGHGSTLTPTNYGYIWYQQGTDYIAGPHQRVHLMLRADFSVGQLREPPAPTNPAAGVNWEIVTDPANQAQLAREFTRFPKLQY